MECCHFEVVHFFLPPLFFVSALTFSSSSFLFLSSPLCPFSPLSFVPFHLFLSFPQMEVLCSSEEQYPMVNKTSPLCSQIIANGLSSGRGIREGPGRVASGCTVWLAEGLRIGLWAG